jgi:phosphate transport system protein
MDAADLSHHTSRRFNEDLEQVRSKVLAMGGLVEEQLRRAMTALADADSSLGRAVAHEDHKVNGMELSIDEECSRILATRAPAAGDLRMVVATIKAITDLERVGDECEKIGLIAARLAGEVQPADRYREVRELGREVQLQLHESLDAFARLDAPQALRAARSDRSVDDAYDAIQRQGMTRMLEDPQQIRRQFDLIAVARALERIGDHAKNLCEYVIYTVSGRDVRHSSLDQVERELAARGG